MWQPVKMLILAGAGFLVGPASLVAPTPMPAGDCLYNCEGSDCYQFSNTSSRYVETRARCLATCSNPGANGKKWGAIAYSPKDKGSGWSHGYDDLNQAKKVAMDHCVQNGAACKVWVYYANECGAIAVDGSIVTWGTAPIRQNANQRAIAECRKAGGRNCALEVSQCSQ